MSVGESVAVAPPDTTTVETRDDSCDRSRSASAGALPSARVPRTDDSPKPALAWMNYDARPFHPRNITSRPGVGAVCRVENRFESRARAIDVNGSCARLPRSDSWRTSPLRGHGRHELGRHAIHLFGAEIANPPIAPAIAVTSASAAVGICSPGRSRRDHAALSAIWAPSPTRVRATEHASAVQTVHSPTSERDHRIERSPHRTEHGRRRIQRRFPGRVAYQTCGLSRFSALRLNRDP